MSIDHPLTFTYKSVETVSHSQAFKLDIYLPEQSDSASPILVYYHAGGLVAGSRARNDWFPEWLLHEALAYNFIFISVDYSLLCPASGHDIVQDVKDCFTWITTKLQEHLPVSRRILPSQLVAAGASAGGYLCHLAAMHAEPKPKAIATLYGMGGGFLSNHYLFPKFEKYQFWMPYLDDPSPYLPYLHAKTGENPIIETIVDDKVEPRVSFFAWLIQTAKFIDVLTGEEGFTSRLAALNEDERGTVLSNRSEGLFPTVNVDSTYPPTIMVHGACDTAVLPQESRNMAKALKLAGVEHIYLEIPGLEHGFDWGKGGRPPCLERVMPFLYRHVFH